MTSLSLLSSGWASAVSPTLPAHFARPRICLPRKACNRPKNGVERGTVSGETRPSSARCSLAPRNDGRQCGRASTVGLPKPSGCGMLARSLSRFRKSEARDGLLVCVAETRLCLREKERSCDRARSEARGSTAPWLRSSFKSSSCTFSDEWYTPSAPNMTKEASTPSLRQTKSPSPHPPSLVAALRSAPASPSRVSCPALDPLLVDTDPEGTLSEVRRSPELCSA